MIRIDEIYNHTFWPWIRDHRPGTRMFFCDPFGHTDPEHLFNHGRDFEETGYIFFHDQEPIQLDCHGPLFQEVVRRNTDISYPMVTPGSVVISEKGEYAEQLESIYGWKHNYYFFHGWACLDWYRGYDRTFLLPHPSVRSVPTRTFMSPNRIIGGDRDHRVLFVYHVMRQNLQKNYISAPRICPVEGQDITVVSKRYCSRYPDIIQVLDQTQLPWLFRDETTQQMSSCWLGNFAEAMDSLIYVPTETVYFGRRTHITEKTFKAIALGMPFVLVAPAGSLEYMRSYGFRTFANIWDESYDEETNDFARLEKVVKLLADIDSLTAKERHQIQRHVLAAVEHNWNHFYGGGFEAQLWTELIGMLDGI